MTSTGLALAVDFGGTKVDAALVHSDGTLVPGSRFRSPIGPRRSSAELEDSVRTAVRNAVAALPAGTRLLGAGVGAAGPIALAEGLTSPLNVPHWRGYPLRGLVESLVPDVPVTMRIDGLCITLAEHWLGAARGRDNVMGMVISTGIGGGLILGGLSVPGPTGNAGHIGHIEVSGFDDPCPCGGRGCIEAVASGPNTVRYAQSRGWVGETGLDLAAACAAGDPIATEAVRRSGHAIGQAIASAAGLVDLDLVAIGGGFSRVSPDLFDAIRGSIAERVRMTYVTRLVVVPSSLSDDGPLIGAAALVHRSHLVQ